MTPEIPTPVSQQTLVLQEPQRPEARASGLQIAATVAGAVFVLVVVLYGLNNQRDEPGGKLDTPTETANSQPAADGQGNQSQASQQQPASPNNRKPGSSANAPATTSQGGNRPTVGASDPHNGNAGADNNAITVPAKPQNGKQ